MNLIVFEQAAVEASAGLQEVDAEIEQLVARRQVLESKKELLDALVHQLLLVLPTENQVVSAQVIDDDAPALPESPAARLFPLISGGQDPKLKDEWAAFVQRSAANAMGSK